MHHRRRLAVAVLLLALSALTACNDQPAPPATLHGQWTGQGVFRTQAGNADVKAQLQLNEDNTYQYLILEPAVLALTGPETGTWTRNNNTLTLTPDAPPPPPTHDEGNPAPTSVFQALRAGSAQRPPQTLTIADNLTTLTQSDSKLQLTFTR